MSKYIVDVKSIREIERFNIFSNKIYKQTFVYFIRFVLATAPGFSIFCKYAFAI